MELRFDHIIHYVDQLNNFKYPGNILKLSAGGKHHKFGTFNRLAYINENYIELLDVEDVEKLKKKLKQKKVVWRLLRRLCMTIFNKVLKQWRLEHQIWQRLQQTLHEHNIETIGPIEMHRENKKGIKRVGNYYILLTLIIWLSQPFL